MPPKLPSDTQGTSAYHTAGNVVSHTLLFTERELDLLIHCLAKSPPLLCFLYHFDFYGSIPSDPIQGTQNTEWVKLLP